MDAAEDVPEEQRTIFAMGGGGFTMEPNNPLLDEFVLELARMRRQPPSGPDSSHATPHPSLSLAHHPGQTTTHSDAPARGPRILFLPTASGDTNVQINAFRARFAGRACIAEHLSLFRLREQERSLAEIVCEQDAIYVGGGSMRNLLALWRAHGLDRLLSKAWRRGTVLAGLSAGAMCWFEGGITCSSGPPEPLAGLGLLPGSLSVHADGEPARLPAWLASVREGVLPGGWAVDDGVGLLFGGRRLLRAVSSRPGAGAVRVDAVAGELVRKRLAVELLGGETTAAGLPSLTGRDEDVQELRQVQRLRRGIRDS
jgi:peptidase E